MRISDWSSDVCSSDLAGRAVIIAYTMPLWAVMLARLTLGDPITPGRLIGLLFGLGGLAILIGPDLRALGAAPAGAAFMLGAAISWAIGTIAVKRSAWTIPTIMLTGDRKSTRLNSSH